VTSAMSCRSTTVNGASTSKGAQMRPAGDSAANSSTVCAYIDGCRIVHGLSPARTAASPAALRMWWRIVGVCGCRTECSTTWPTPAARAAATVLAM